MFKWILFSVALAFVISLYPKQSVKVFEKGVAITCVVVKKSIDGAKKIWSESEARQVVK